MNLYRVDMGWEGGYALIADNLQDAQRKLREYLTPQNMYPIWVEATIADIEELPITAVVEFRGDS